MFFIVTFHQIVFYSLCFGRSWLLIHLMLKLISHQRPICCHNLIVSIHLMLKLIGTARSDYFAGIIVSIHPMLKLIRLPRMVMKKILSFNTSHVKVNLLPPLLPILLYPRFNTSHVKVNLGMEKNH